MSTFEPPKGYASTEVWAAFERWVIEADTPGLPEHINPVEVFWPSFRDGFSAGLLLHQSEDAL